MQKHHYEAAAEALIALKIYSGHYASSEPYQQRLQEIIEILNHQASTAPADSRAQRFLKGFAQALLDENK